jgi:hypothetical protein
VSERNDPARSREAATAVEVGERVTAVLKAAEDAASAIRQEAESEAQRYLDERRREGDELLSERRRRIAKVNESLISRAEALVSRFGEAEELKRQLGLVTAALAGAAKQLAADAAEEGGSPPLSVVPDEAQSAQTEPAPAAQAEAPQRDPAAGPDQEVAETAASSGEVSVLERLRAAAGSQGQTSLPERRGRFEREEGRERHELSPVEDKLLAARLVALQMAVAGSARDEVERHLRKVFELDDPKELLDSVFGSADS